MTEPAGLDIAALREWIGRAETARDVVTPRLVEEFRATLDDAALDGATLDGATSGEGGAEAPLAIHWCLAPPAAATASLGPDGHPARGDARPGGPAPGGFLPPVPLPRRMWAGSALTLHDKLRAGDAVERRSRVADVTVKQGRTGRLCFVSVDHEFATDRGIAIAERQEIVYRDLPSGQPPQARKESPQARQDSPPARQESPPAQWWRDGEAGPVLLFRYSALTFNGHRIHYDRRYVTEVEFYPGLIVHGPLQATLLIRFAASLKGTAPRRFAFRGLQPLFDFERFRLCARETEAGLHLWTETSDGRQTMDATAAWA